jgi:dTMP kinase
MASVSEEVAALRGTRSATIKDLLRRPAFSRLAAAMAVSSLGDWIGFVAVTTLVANLGGSGGGFAVAGVLFFRLLPSVLFGPFAGALVDRLDRKKMMVAADVGRGAMYAAMPFLGRLWAIFLLSFLIECLSLIWTPSRDASLPNLVPRRQLPNANAVSMITTYGTLPVGGFLFAVSAVFSAWLGSHAAYLSYLGSHTYALALWLDAATFAFSAVMVSGLPLRALRREARRRVHLSDLGRDVVDGVNFLRDHPLASVMTTGIVVAFSAVGAVMSLGPLFAKGLGSNSGAAWGVIVTTFGIGMAFGLLVVNWASRLMERERLFWMSMVGSACSLIMLAVQATIGLAATMAVILGSFVGLTWVTGYTLLQETVADEFRGRTFASITVLSRFGLFVSFLLFPSLASLIGLHHFVHVGRLGIDLGGYRGALAIAGLAVVGGGLYTRRGLQRYRISMPKRLNLIPRLKKAPPEGVFVVFEGVEGSGKGTQIELARKALEQAGRKVVVTREPGGTPVGERLRAMLLDPGTGHLEPRTEALLFSAARAQLVTSVIRPALEAGNVVICDRYVDSSIAYQGVARGLGEPDVLSLNVWATQGLFPDLVVLLHIEPEAGLERARHDDDGADRIESEPDVFHAKVSDAYLRIAEEHPERFAVIDASGPRASVHDKVMEAIERALPVVPSQDHGESGGSQA